MKSTVKISGLKEVETNLAQLSKATARNTLRRVLTKAAQPMAERMAELAPDDPATDAPDLKTSILVTPSLKNPVGNAEFAEVMKAGGSKADAVQAMRDARRDSGETFANVYVGPDARVFYAHLQEFGTAHHPPQPFARPAYEETKGRVLDSIVSMLGSEVDKAIARLRRRQAKKAAGG